MVICFIFLAKTGTGGGAVTRLVEGEREMTEASSAARRENMD
jgi:hypothetical protein